MTRAFCRHYLKPKTFKNNGILFKGGRAMRVTIAGYGTGVRQGCLPDVQRALDAAGLVLGAPRLLDSAGIAPPRGIAAVNAGEIAAAINAAQAGSACVLMSGDSGFYSGARLLLPLLTGHEVTVLPGISSVQALSAALQMPWQGWRLCWRMGLTAMRRTRSRAMPSAFFSPAARRRPTRCAKRSPNAAWGRSTLLSAQI